MKTSERRSVNDLEVVGPCRVCTKGRIWSTNVAGTELRGDNDAAAGTEPELQGGTLVVVPKSILSQWAQELHDKVPIPLRLFG